MMATVEQNNNNGGHSGSVLALSVRKIVVIGVLCWGDNNGLL